MKKVDTTYSSLTHIMNTAGCLRTSPSSYVDFSFCFKYTKVLEFGRQWESYAQFQAYYPSTISDTIPKHNFMHSLQAQLQAKYTGTTSGTVSKHKFRHSAQAQLQAQYTCTPLGTVSGHTIGHITFKNIVMVVLWVTAMAVSSDPWLAFGYLVSGL